MPGRGNLSFCTNDPSLADTVKSWCNGSLKCEPPKCYNDLYDEGVVGQLIAQLEDSMAQELAMTAFPAEMAQEEQLENEEENNFLDSIVADEDIGNDVDEQLIQEREMLEELPLPGHCRDEAERKRCW